MLARLNDKSKQPSNWLRLDSTQELIQELEHSSNMRTEQKAIEVINGGNYRGTYVCKELVYAYAMWINARFHLYVIRTFDEVIEQDYQRQRLRELAKVEYKLMTDAIKFEKEHQEKEVKYFHFSNEADLINRIALGMTSAKFKVFHEIGKTESIRDYLTPCQIKCITDLQRANTTFIQLGMEFEDRKVKLMELFKRNHIISLFDEQHHIAA
ncbi:KilA-N domain-containing protein [Gilliamella sp. B2776]|uniref:KilA-N domain-containing protein n=1 Tax=unclassified Gilliamella TaxID=2685620 RepID=UPI002269F602|nr:MULTISPECIES: KilA-N domain-containing protein [unclassified Gilliamella]MCX8650962.1 KilA-N domain-containing protein [Gilliamella sp. B2779]MCX8653544.1 KilA-N domain-containing protein [Gilliamella sp. B2737]MCX8656523.1 KilA-N domain-containing protein [Gilliamella sp. B2894]MCX8692774.1 KilA-N domain-containing protein [Gilliamella sp. B2776]MCX8693166.1 KilA-N domain-containing protein [Gilliamella sp. B2881]